MIRLRRALEPLLQEVLLGSERTQYTLIQGLGFFLRALFRLRLGFKV